MPSNLVKAYLKVTIFMYFRRLLETLHFLKIHTCGSSVHAQLQFSYRTISCPNQGALSIRKSAVNLAGRRAAFDGKRSRLLEPVKLAPVVCRWRTTSPTRNSCQSTVTAATRQVKVFP